MSMHVCLQSGRCLIVTRNVKCAKSMLTKTNVARLARVQNSRIVHLFVILYISAAPPEAASKMMSHCLFTLAATIWLGIAHENGDECARIIAVAPKSPADKAHLRENDCIVRIGEHAIASSDALDRFSSADWLRAGEAVPIELKGGKTVTVTPSERPDEVEKSLCLTMSKKRTIVWARSLAGERSPQRFSFHQKPTVGKLRQLLNASGRATVFINDICNISLKRTAPVHNAPDAYVVSSGALVEFHEANESMPSTIEYFHRSEKKDRGD